MNDELQAQLDLLRDPDPVRRGQTAEALKNLARDPGSETAHRALVGLQQDPDVMVRFKAARELAWLEDDRGLETLVWALGRKELCFMSLEALTRLGAPSARPPLQRIFKKWFLHPLERIQAAAALYRCGDQQGRVYLQACLESSRPEERGFALEQQGKLGLPGALDLLQEVLSDPRETHRLDAARGLGHLGDQRSLPLLDRIARQPEDELLAQTAREAASAIRESGQEE